MQEGSCVKVMYYEFFVLLDPKLGFLFEELRKHEAESKEKNERTSACNELSQELRKHEAESKEKNERTSACNELSQVLYVQQNCAYLNISYS
jgi:hypothetical protein